MQVVLQPQYHLRVLAQEELPCPCKTSLVANCFNADST